ncbi:Major facilitator superfamily MFS_1 [Hyella patelloides LEGE 07179]|uniref:Major facilitator superfamily MFS_1 n=1 Tax=Hyella patelloides LEGE 07179 TaxID=945734 RepID=A0A563VZU3_9CYAN|nr:MFS transporter [Hyella patelloides]VEP16887.1 Major facilitator superfamily MFS_1 [Hyella patelloides LEGE 07179]
MFQYKLPRQFWIIATIAFVNSISFTIIIPLLYPYAKQFALSDLQASLLTTAYALAQFLGTPVLGKLSDRMGRKPILIVSLLGTVLANILASVSNTALLLYLARIFDGLTGANNSVASAVISDITTPEQRPQAFGIFAAIFRLGFVVGPALSYVAQQLPTLPGISPLGMSFVVAAVIACFAVMLTLFFLPETLPQSTPKSFKLSWQDFTFSKIAKSATKPKLGKLFILTFLSGASFTIFTFAFQPFFLNVLDRNPKELAIAFSLVGMLGFISQVFALEPLRNKFNLIDILAMALFIRGVTFFLMPTFPTITAFAIILAIFSLVNAFPMPLIESILSLNTKQQEQGEILGINASYLSIANAFGPFISGLLVSFGYKMPLWLTGCLTMAIAWYALGVKSEFKCYKQTE